MKSILFILTLTLVLLLTNSSGTRLLHSAQPQTAQPQTEAAQNTIDEERPIINNICNDQAAEKGSQIESTFISGKTIIHFYGII